MNRIIYIIGGVCTGKSTLARAFEQKGAHYIDLDSFGKLILSSEDVLLGLERLGVRDLRDNNNQPKRSAIFNFLTSSKENMLATNAFLHPIYLECLHRRVDSIKDDLPIVIECSAYSGQFKRQDDMFLRDADVVIATYVPMSTRVLWASNRGIDKNRFDVLVDMQPSQQVYEQACDFIFENSQRMSLVERDEKIARLWTSCCK